MSPFWPALVIFALLAWIASAYYFRFIRDVERDFPSLWQEIGSPTDRGDDALSSWLGTYWYLYRRRYEKRSDIAERRFCEELRSRMLVTYVGALLSLVALFTVFFIWGAP